MALALNEEQRSLRDTAKEFSQNQSPIASFRQLRDNRDPAGYSLDVWQNMVELGWTGMIYPEAYGGFEFGIMGLASCMEEFGHTLVASPLLSSVVLAGNCILQAGSEEQKQAWLPSIVSGEKRLALAVDEGIHHNPLDTQTTVSLTDDGHFTINGNKRMVIDGNAADTFVVVVRTGNQPGQTAGISLLLVDANTPGLTCEKVVLIDSRGYANLQFDNVRVPASAMLGDAGQAFDALDHALDLGRICLASEMFGGMQEIFDRTVQYLKERKQFGVLIGSFQALQHRAAHMYTELEMCKSLLMLALNALETGAADAPQLVSAAKARMSEAYELISNEATQMHGGIGVTDELDIGLFLKRARVTAALLGSCRFHYDRYATLESF